MDTKTQSLPITHTQPHSNAWPQSHTCSQCNCGPHYHTCSRSWAQGCGQGCGQSRNQSRSRSSSHSPTGHQNQSPSPSPLPRHQKHNMHPHHCPRRATTHSCSHPKKRKNVERKVNKRKVPKRSQQVYKTKRRNSVADEQSKTRRRARLRETFFSHSHPSGRKN